MSSQFIKLLFPLTTHTGKIRVKKRKDIFYQGLPVATRQTPLDSDCYLEWQISYDLRKDNSSFEKHYESVKNKGEIRNEEGESTARYIYELSDYLIEIIGRKFIGLEEIKKLLKEIKGEKEFLTDELEIYRSHPKPFSFKQWAFLKCTITYPLLIYEVRDLLIKVEIVVKEKQKAVGIQPMLYLCIPLKLMEEFPQLENKLVSSKQKASYLVDKNNFHFIIETIWIFALLSKKHHRDVVNILMTVLDWNKIYEPN